MFRDPLAAPAPADLSAGLSPAQVEAVNHGDGPALVLSGAGSGKTRVIVTRLIRLITDNHARAGETLSLTFTREAAAEMLGRLIEHLGPAGERAVVKTFHALFLGFLRERPAVAHLRDGFTVVQPDAGVRILRDMIRETGAEDVAEDGDRVKALYGMVTRIKDLGHTPETLLEAEHAVRADFDRDEDKALFDAAAEWYLPYQARLRRENMADFADFLLWPTLAMERDDALRHLWADRFRYVQVDEYQDTNALQERALTCLARDHRNLFAVGDEDQSIYRFRGSDPRFILSFAERWPGAVLYKLMTNWRSTPNILAGANALIAHNPARYAKEMTPPDGRDHGTPIVVGAAEGPRDEAAWAVEICRQGLAEGWRTAMITYRANYMSREVEEQCIAAGLTYRLVGDVGFYQRQEVKDALAYLRWADDPTDLAAWRRIANVPTRGLGEKTMDAIELAARDHAGDLLAAAAALKAAGALRADAADGVMQLQEACSAWRDAMFEGDPLDQRLDALLTRTGYYAWWETHDDPKAEQRRQNLGELLEVAAQADGTQALLDRAARAERAQTDDAPLSLTSVHAAKGKEADGVVNIGWEEGTFPSRHALELADQRGKPRSLHDERNLAYVALSRAAREAYVTWSEGRGDPGGPSRFIAEFAGGAGVVTEDKEIPTLPGADAPSTPRQRELMTLMVRALSDVTTPDPGTVDSKRRLSLWIDRHMPAFRAARAGLPLESAESVRANAAGAGPSPRDGADR